jgi:acyl-coenzyme A thioesterase PaaI-like protein
MFAAIMARLGRLEMAVTTNLNINFLRRPAPEDLVADAVILKLGKRLAVLEVSIFSGSEVEQSDAEPVAHVTGTYSLPPG